MIKDVLSAVLGGVWKMMLAVDYPGIGVSIAGVLIAFFLMRVSVMLFRYIAGFSAGGGDYGKAANHIERYKSRKNNSV